MSRDAAEIRRAFEQSGAMMKPSYTREELLPGYMEFQEIALRQLFNNDYSNAMRMYDAREHLRQACSQYGLADTERFRRLDYTLVQFSKITAALVNGARGEQVARRSIECLRCKHAVVYNLEAEYECMRIECDAVVVTPWGIVIVEVKWGKHDVEIDEDGFMHNRGAARSYNYNIGEKGRTKEYVVWHQLNKVAPGLVPYDRVRTVLVMANNNTACDNRFGKIEVLRCGTLPYAIEGLQGSPCLTDEQVELVGKALESIRCQHEYPSEIDFDQLRSDLAEMISEIERASERAERERHREVVVAAPDCCMVSEFPVTPVAVRENRKPSYEYAPAWGWFGAGVGVGSAIAGAIALLARRNAA